MVNDKITEGLDSTERMLFCKALKSYESKEFKKGIKMCNTILSTTKGANHPETLALKGALLSCTGQSDEGYHICKRGISKDFNSYMCWHILGIVERDRRNYASSLACFRTAFKRNPSNVQILRDLGNLQLHQGDYLGNMDTREKMHQLQPNQITNTIGYSYGCYLCKHYQKSLEVLDNAETAHPSFHSQLNPQELNNLLLFKGELLCQLGRFEELESFVKTNEEKLLDKENLLQLTAKCDQLNQKYDVAAEKYLQLLLLMPNNENYADKYVENFELIHPMINKLQPETNENTQHSSNINNNVDNDEPILLATHVDNETNQEMVKRHSRKIIYRSLIEYIPDSLMLKQRFMNLATLEEFDPIIDDYLKVSLEKHVPQAINTLRYIYDMDFEGGKIELIQEKLEALIEHHSQSNDLLQWCHYYMATHFRLIDSLDQSLSHLKQCLQLNKSMHDAIILIAKIYRSVENFNCANRVMKYVCDMVPSDRYTNTITGKYFFYVNNNELADRYLQRFSRNNETIDNYMREVQNVWYRIHKASLFYREKKYFDALYNVRLAECHFEQFTYDKVDFHYYCMRHTFLKAHEDLLLQDSSLRRSKFYWHLLRIGAKILMGIYHSVYDLSASYYDSEATVCEKNASPSSTTADNPADAANGNDCAQPPNQISAAKLKKQERQKKLKEMKKENRTNGVAPQPKIINKKPAVCCPKKHVDNTPEKLKEFYGDKSNLNTILEQLKHYASLLHTNFNDKFKTQTSLFEIHLTTGDADKLLETYQQMIFVHPNHFKLFWYEYRMLKYFVELGDSLDETTKTLALSYVPITDFKDSKFRTYISLKLCDFVKKYQQDPWNMVTYILVATNLGISNLIEPTARTLFDLLKNEPDIFSYMEVTKFRKFVRKYLPSRMETLDEIIATVFPAIFSNKDSIDYLD